MIIKKKVSLRNIQTINKQTKTKLKRQLSLIGLKGPSLPEILKNKQDEKQKKISTSIILNQQRWNIDRLQYLLYKKELKIKKINLIDQEIKKKRFFQQVGLQIYDIAVCHPKLQFLFGMKNKNLYSVSFGKYLNMLFRMETFFEVYQLKRIHSTIQISHQFYSIIKGLIFNKLFINQQFNINQLVLGGVRMQRNRGSFVNYKQEQSKTLFNNLCVLFNSQRENLNSYLQAVADFVLNFNFNKILYQTKQKPFYLWEYIKLKNFLLKKTGQDTTTVFAYNKILQNLGILKYKFLNYSSLKSQILQKFNSLQQFFQQVLKLKKTSYKTARIIQFLLHYIFQDQQYIFSKNQVLTCTGLMNNRELADLIYLQIINVTKFYNFRQTFANQLLQRLRSLRTHQKVILNCQDVNFMKLKQILQQILITYKRSHNINSNICPAQQLAAICIGFQPYTKQQLKVLHQNSISMRAMVDFKCFVQKSLEMNQVSHQLSKNLLKRMRVIQKFTF